MMLKNKRTRDIGDATNVQNSMNGTTKSAERKYSISIPFEVMDFLGNDLMIVSPKRFSKIKAFRYLLSRHIDGLENGELKRNYISQLSKDWKWTRQTVVSFLRSLQEMNVIDIKLILRAKMVSINPTIVVANLSKEELDKMAQLSLTQLSLASSHISSGETK
ncbi:hypothetical protein ACQRBO_00015 [Segatella copri]|uniref:hypothetical protein n=1 Tax=Segatella copri TaxID=165179 RepID=UPI003D04BC84